MEEKRKKDIAARLRSLRGEKTQREVADAVDVSTMAISQYENGERVPSDPIKIKLAKYYGTTVENLFFAE